MIFFDQRNWEIYSRVQIIRNQIHKYSWICDWCCETPGHMHKINHYFVLSLLLLFQLTISVFNLSNSVIFGTLSVCTRNWSIRKSSYLCNNCKVFTLIHDQKIIFVYGQDLLVRERWAQRSYTVNKWPVHV